MSLKCAIIDDEPLAVDIIKNYLKQIKGVELVASFNSALDSLEFFQQNQVDLLFLDINMPVLDGYSFLKSLANKPQVIITTAHEEYAVQGYELEILDYLVKPIPFPRFLQAVNKGIRKLEKPKEEDSSWREKHLFLKINKKKMKKVYLDDILLIESLKDYIKIITKDKDYVIHQTLSSFTESLPKEHFIRIHRSYTVSLDKVDTLEGNSLEIDGKRYVIGRSYLNDVKDTILDS
ncbi:two component transcriptional regulator, LytTR family [Salegentibacter echinorum]|uniref:Two component transcriptional regulator, LytTR family n=1 Tax=Salegentibacter echinorum TaxID=1073325 RepID=A0A1M5I7V6_SALEC|nr:LytTR family DNA-binding domain-containing protein [Salegentibacter echinorum]SHG24189.1 two component transcriptional regulator, LytTR family [Salegentibacter echinorum]